MARVTNRRLRAASARPAPTSIKHSAALQHAKPYKVVLEQVREKKRKLVTVLSFQAKPPAGYTFIPAGDPQLTNRCKSLAREEGLKIFMVSTSKNSKQRILSQEVHRIGYHFPNLVVERACMSLGVSLTRSGHIILNESNPFHTYSKHNAPTTITKNTQRNDSPSSDVSQATLDTQAREAIKDLFPKIPDKDVHQIISRAFQKGKERVGTAAKLPLVRRVQLAVVAHIRHIYTNYDKLLRKGDYVQARAQVEQPTLDKLLTWRRDDDDDPNAMEGILREVIVIPDDDEEDKSKNHHFAGSSQHGREDSFEVVSDHAIADEVQTRPVDYGMMDIHADPNRLYSPDMDTGSTIRYVRREPFPYQQQIQHGQRRVDRFEVYRHRVWEEALHRRRKDPQPLFLSGHCPIAPASARPNQQILLHDHAEPRSQWPEGSARRPHLIEYMGKAPPREQLSYPAFPLDSKPVGIGYVTDHRRDPPGEIVGTSRQVSEIHPLTIVTQAAIALLKRNVYYTEDQQVSRSLQELPGTIRQKTSDPLNVPYGREANQQPILYPVSQAKQSRMPHARENQSLVGAQPPERELGDSVHGMPSPHSSRRHFERILPSIEGNTARVRNQFGISGGHIEHTSPSFKSHNTLVRAKDPVPQSFHSNNDWDQLDIERRRVEGLTSFSREEPPLLKTAYEPQRTILIPLQDESKHHTAGWQPAQPGYSTGRRPAGEEMQIMLPHRMEVVDDSDKQHPSRITHTLAQGTSQQGHIVDAEQPKYAPREHFQIQLSRAGIREQADLISKPLRAQPELHQSFPVSHTSHKNVSTSYGAVEPYVSLHHHEDFGARGDRKVEGATIVRTKPLKFYEPETVTQPQLRDLVVRPSRNEKYTEEYNNSSMMRRAGFEDPQYGDGNRYISTKTRIDNYEQWQPDHYTARPSVQNLEPQREAHNQSTRTIGRLMPKHKNSEVQYPLLADLDERHVVRSLPRSGKPQRNQDAQRREQLSHGHYQSARPAQLLESTHRNGRLVQPVDEDRYPGLRDQRAQREVVVID